MTVRSEKEKTRPANFEMSNEMQLWVPRVFSPDALYHRTVREVG